MGKYIHGVIEYFEYKLPAAIWTALWVDDYAILLCMFIGMELLDVFTRWLALSRKCYKDIYPQSECSLWRAFTFLWQARKWRYIKSTGLRDGFCDKTLLYLILLALAGFVDGILGIAKVPKMLTSIIATVLALTEALSILENLSDCQVKEITVIKDRFAEKANKLLKG